MPFENVEVLGIALNFLATYIAEKGLDKLVDGKVHSYEEMSVEEHVYCMLTESLEDFCEKLGIEFDEDAIFDTYTLTSTQLRKLNCKEQLKLILEKATAIELTAEDLEIWVKIVEDNLVSDKHVKLFRAIQLKSINEKKENIIEPAWMQKYMVDNAIEVTFENTMFDDLFSNIKTGLSNECWIQTQDLLTELSFNAFQHGRARNISLFINENTISVQDDGMPFDITMLMNSSSQLHGGNWTLKRYVSSYPNVNISYNRIGEKNKTSIEFQDKVFNVNNLCEIVLSENMVCYKTDIKLRYSNSKARYYYIDFSNFKAARSFLCMSGACFFIDRLIEFCASQNTEVFLYLPSENMLWDDFAEKIYECLKWGTPSDKIHVIRE